MGATREALVRTTQRWGCLNFAAAFALVVLFVAALAIGSTKLAHSGGTMWNMVTDMHDATLNMNTSMGAMIGEGLPIVQMASQRHTVEVATEFLRALTPLVRNVDPAAVTNMTKAASAVLANLGPLVQSVRPEDVRLLIARLHNLTLAANDIAQRFDHGGGLSLHLEGT
jgi:hypothetical protein